MNQPFILRPDASDGDFNICVQYSPEIGKGVLLIGAKIIFANHISKVYARYVAEHLLLLLLGDHIFFEKYEPSDMSVLTSKASFVSCDGHCIVSVHNYSKDSIVFNAWIVSFDEIVLVADAIRKIASED